MPAARSSAASPAVATASQVAPPASAAARGRDGAVAVAVGLHHRAQRGAARAAASAAARSCARSRRGRRARARAGASHCPRRRARRARRARVTTPTRRPSSTTGQAVVAGLVRSVARPRARRRPGATVVGSAVIMSAAVEANAFLSAPRSAAAARGTSSRRTARCSAGCAGRRSSSGDHEVVLGHDPDAAAVAVDDRHAGQLVLAAARAPRPRRSSSGRTPSRGRASMMSPTGRPLRRGPYRFDAQRLRRAGRRLDHVARHHVVGPDARAAARPAQRVRQHAARGRARTGRRRFASSAPITPESTSPVPAVASAGVAPGLTPPARRARATSVSSPFSTTIAPLRSAASRACASRCAATSLGVDVQQAAELALVRGQHGRRVALAQRLERARRGRSARRRRSAAAARHRAATLARERRGAVRAAEPRAEHHARPRARPAPAPRPAPAGDVRRRPRRAAPAHHLEQRAARAPAAAAAGTATCT